MATTATARTPSAVEKASGSSALPAAGALRILGPPPVVAGKKPAPTSAPSTPAAPAARNQGYVIPKRSLDDNFIDGSVECMAASARPEFSDREKADAVVTAATAVLKSIQDPRLTIRDVRRSPPKNYFAQRCASLVDTLAAALSDAHASASGLVFWPTPKEYAEDRDMSPPHTVRGTGSCRRDRDNDRDGDDSGRGGGGGGSGRGAGGRRDHRGGGNDRDRRHSSGRSIRGSDHGSGGGGGGKRRDTHRGSGGGSKRSGGGGERSDHRGHRQREPTDSDSMDSSSSGFPSVKIEPTTKRQVPSLVNVTAEKLASLSFSDNRAQPLSSALARARQASVDKAAAKAEDEYVASVGYNYVNVDTRKVQRICTLPPSNENQALAAQHLMRSAKQAQTDILQVCDKRCSLLGLQTEVWIRGWERPLHKAFVRAIPLDKPSTPILTTVIDDIFGQVTRALDRKETGPAAFELLLQLLSRQFDHGDAASALRDLQSFGVPNGTPYSAYYRAFRMVVSGITGSERALAPGTGLVLEIVRLSVNEQYPQLMPILYPGGLANRQSPFETLDAMWLALGVLADNKTPAINGEKFYSLPSTSSAGQFSASSSASPAARGHGQGRAPLQSSAWATGSKRNPVIMNVSDASNNVDDPWATSSSYSHWPLAHCDEVCAVSGSFTTDDPPLWSGLLSPPARAAALRENQGRCLNCHETSHSFKQCQHPFINASGCINPELGQLGDNGDAYRRWQDRMLRYRRGNKIGGGAGNGSRKGRRHRSGRQHGNGNSRNDYSHNSGRRSQDARSGHTQQHSDSGYGQHTNSSALTVHHSAPPSPAPSGNNPAMRLGASYTTNDNPNARQPGTFRSGN